MVARLDLGGLDWTVGRHSLGEERGQLEVHRQARPPPPPPPPLLPHHNYLPKNPLLFRVKEIIGPNDTILPEQ